MFVKTLCDIPQHVSTSPHVWRFWDRYVHTHTYIYLLCRYKVHIKLGFNQYGLDQFGTVNLGMVSLLQLCVSTGESTISW